MVRAMKYLQIVNKFRRFCFRRFGGLACYRCSRGAGYFGRAKAACLYSYCGNRHLCYDEGRLERVKIVTLMVGAKAKEGKRGEGGRGEKNPLSPRPIPRSF